MTRAGLKKVPIVIYVLRTKESYFLDTIKFLVSYLPFPTTFSVHCAICSYSMIKTTRVIVYWEKNQNKDKLSRIEVIDK